MLATLTVTWKEKSPTELLLRTAFTWEETTGSIKCPSLLQQYAFPTEWVTSFSPEFSPNPTTGHTEKPSDPGLKLFNLTPTDTHWQIISFQREDAYLTVRTQTMSFRSWQSPPVPFPQLQGSEKSSHNYLNSPGKSPKVPLCIAPGQAFPQLSQ